MTDCFFRGRKKAIKKQTKSRQEKQIDRTKNSELNRWVTAGGFQPWVIDRLQGQ